jgi:hypothetical protein
MSSRRAAADDLSCRTSDELLAFGRSLEAMPQSWRSTMHPTVLPLRTPDGTMPPAPASMTTVEANGVTHGVEQFGEATAPLILLAGGTTMLSWPDALCEALARGNVTSCGTTCATAARRPSSIPRHPRTRCAISQPTPQHWPANSTTRRRTWRVSASVAWWPRSPRSTTRTRSRRSPSPGRGPSHLAGSTRTCLTMTRRR